MTDEAPVRVVRPVVRSGGSRRSRRFRLALALAMADAAAIFVALMLATWVRFGSATARVAFDYTDLHIAFWQLTVVTVPLWVGFIALAGLYDLDRVTFGITDSGRIARALSLGLVALILVTYMARVPGLSRAWTLLAWVFSILLVLLARVIFSAVRSAGHRRGRWLQPTLIVGSNAESADIIRVLHASPEAGLVPLGCLTSSQAERLELDFCSDDVPVLGSAREITAVLEESCARTVIIASSAFDHDVLARMIAELRDADVDVHISSGLFEVLTSRVLVSEIAGVPLITVKGISLSRGNLLVKRVFDLVMCSIIVVLGVPVWIAIGLAIKLTSPGPIFYAQQRVGRAGETFGMLKFRSMYRDADSRLADLRADNEASGPLFKMKDDPRVTPTGKWLRKFSLDEFPQLINVVRGEMSLVGPRPPLPHEVEKYSPNDWRRLEVVPGMTGLWQVSGRSSLTFDEMVRLDLFYIENWSVGLDLTLLFRTIPAVLFARGAY
ncbi:MAG: sugar transferase [Coriobacteriia bacterium]|nr:sugar transferase [Coriobacteriia bacterium]